MPNGQIIKALSGFYYVKTETTVFQCKGRGVFRKKNITPLVGDFVTFDIDENNEGYITSIHPRTTELIRPPIANIDQAIIVSSASMPEFSSVLLDRFLVLVEAKGIKPIIFITKMDIVSDEKKKEIDRYRADYEKIGYQVELISAKLANSLQQLEHYFTGHTTVIAGQSGVGKSSLLNALDSSLLLKTAAISKSLGRGKHTTRHVELVELYDGLVADTPGFSALEFNDMSLEHLASCFPEMEKLQHECKFRGCMHLKEPNCAVKAAVKTNEIAPYRYEHYVRFYDEIQLRKQRY